LKGAFATDAVLIRGSGGVFDVVVDGSLEYSKHATGEFPDEDTLIRQLTPA
jgi:predicted Rdx family selenoprotein